ncbi:MAG: sulfatase [bacterium]
MEDGTRVTVIPLRAAAVVLAGFMLACSPETPTPEEPITVTPARDDAPNIVLIVVDTLRADHLGTYGFPHGSSPNIDALAAKSVVFDYAIAASSRTAPSHASMMTSRFARENSIGFHNGTTRLEGAVTLAGILKRAGYRTGAFIGNMLLHSRLGMDHGFDVYDEDLSVQEKNRNEIFERRANQTAERAIAWVNKEGGEPYFLWLHLQDPHGPYTPPQEFAEQIHIQSPADEPELPVVAGTDGQDGIPEYQHIEGLNRLTQYQERYAEEIAFADHWIGEVVKTVDARSSPRETIVVLTADHGEAMGEAGRHFVHGLTCTPEVARVPFLIRAAGLTPERRDELVHHVDILPTILEGAGLAIPEQTSGRPLGPIVRGEQRLAERLLYCDVGNEIGVYLQDRTFYRVMGKRALELPSFDGKPRPEPLWTRYRWNVDESWSLLDDQVPEKDEVRAYVRNAVKNVGAPRFDDQEIDRLRALGYVE